jgi:flagellar protein FlaG
MDMDMSVKLNLSYPAIPTPSSAAAPSATVPAVNSPAVATGSKDSSSSSSSDSDSKKLKQAVQDIQKFVQSIKRNLEFSIDKTSGRVVVKVIATDTGEVVRQIPTEEVLKLADSLSTAGNVLFNGKA